MMTSQSNTDKLTKTNTEIPPPQNFSSKCAHDLLSLMSNYAKQSKLIIQKISNCNLWPKQHQPISRSKHIYIAPTN